MLVQIAQTYFFIHAFFTILLTSAKMATIVSVAYS